MSHIPEYPKNILPRKKRIFLLFKSNDYLQIQVEQQILMLPRETFPMKCKKRNIYYQIHNSFVANENKGSTAFICVKIN